METKKRFVIAHNAFHGAWLWDQFKPLLEAAGHEVTTFDLAASGDDSRDIDEICSVDAYTEPLLDVMGRVPEGEKVILVGHSFGTVNAAIAMDKYPEKVAVAVFLNGLVPDTTNKPSYVLDKVMYGSIFRTYTLFLYRLMFFFESIVHGDILRLQGLRGFDLQLWKQNHDEDAARA